MGLAYRLVTLMTVVVFTAKSCGLSNKIRYTSEKLVLIEEAKNTYRHISFLKTESWGKVPCNGLVYIYDGTAYVFDTPVDDSASMELIRWVEEEMHASVGAVFINHFHVDCLGGLKAFHANGIESYSTNKTIALAEKHDAEVPHVGFEDTLIMKLGGDFIVHRYFGAAHTDDNMVSYIGGPKVLFGGCMIKSIGAGKGNLADADTIAWPVTVEAVKEEFDKAKIIVPGHGSPGGRELLDYTIRLFDPIP